MHIIQLLVLSSYNVCLKKKKRNIYIKKRVSFLMYNISSSGLSLFVFDVSLL